MSSLSSVTSGISSLLPSSPTTAIPDDVRSNASSATAVSIYSSESKLDPGLLCSLCNSVLSNPRTLSCLHVFDAACLETRVSSSTSTTNTSSGENSKSLDPSSTSPKPNSKAADLSQHWIDCPVCEQRTTLVGAGACSPCELVRTLPRDLAVLDNVILSACDGLKLKCTRCLFKQLSHNLNARCVHIFF